MYIKYEQITDTYILYKYDMGMAQGEESFLDEIITTGNDREELERIGRNLYPTPVSTAGGWRSETYKIVVNTATEEGNKLYEEQKAISKKQWEHIKQNPEQYEGITIIGNPDDLDSNPIAIEITHNPELDKTPSVDWNNSSYTYIVWNVPKETDSND